MNDRRGRIESDSLAPVEGTTPREGALASAFIDAAIGWSIDAEWSSPPASPPRDRAPGCRAPSRHGA